MANFCSNCGSKVDDGAKFCEMCGAQILSADSNPGVISPNVSPTVPVKRNTSSVRIVIGILVYCMAAIGPAFAIGDWHFTVESGMDFLLLFLWMGLCMVVGTIIMKSGNGNNE